MRIAIDARWVSQSQPGGFQAYVQNLLTGLSSLPDDFHIDVYLESPSAKIPADRRFSIVILRSRIPIIRAIIREQIQLPWHLGQSEITVAHFPCNTGPIHYNGPCVLTLHDVLSLQNPYPRFRRPWTKTVWAFAIEYYSAFVIPRISHYVQAIITVSEYEKRLILDRLRLGNGKVFVIYLAPSSVFYPAGDPAQVKSRVRDEYGVASFILGVGSKPSKNVIGLVRAYATLVKSMPCIHQLVLVVPHQAYRLELELEAARLGVADRVAFLNGMPQEELWYLYNAADLFAFPSWRESFGLPPLEAMACGTPVVAGRASCLPEVLGNAAIWVDPASTEDIAQAMWRVLSNPSLARNLSDRGLQHVKRYSWQRTAQMTLEVYREVASRRARAQQETP